MEKVRNGSSNRKYILGMEGSANKLGISIINDQKKILVNMRRTYVSEIGCGFIPREINAHHKFYIIDMIKDCLQKLKIKITDITLICYTRGPGIGSALYIAYNICKIFSLLFNIPVIGVNHCIAHIEMGIFITRLKKPIILYVSGSNTQIIYFNDHKKRYEIIGETLDIAIGNVIDRSARILRISNSPSPGYNVEMWARKKYILNMMKREKQRHMKLKNELGVAPSLVEHSQSECIPMVESINDDKYTAEGQQVHFAKKATCSAQKEVRENSCDYTELLFFPYTIKGMDISFSGYDFYISKYFSKYASRKEKKAKEKGVAEEGKKKKKKHCSQQKGDHAEMERVESAENSSDENVNKDTSANANSNTTANTSKRAQDTGGFLHRMKGNSYYEEDIVYQSEDKKNFGDGEEYVEDDCTVETDSDFYESEEVNGESALSGDPDDSGEISNRGETSKLTEEDKRRIQICYSLQHHIFSMLIEITERAISFTDSKEVIIVGGVGCNLFLQNMMKKMARQKNIKIGFMDHSYCVDNGAMIAYTGYIEYENAKDKSCYNFENISIHQRYRTDDVLVTWR
ncbi:tRNA N6-adenosine threonylcarbamoyltransferase, putative [Plasmodium ovale]|uniref:N(6)-L-threonylcarbamoyladenine synthase n=2 Tax=Plasmodium ovale TaxID=36330 RepID=A0A1A8VZE6_PLAOA|nr:tRNA N6-adenosine threonylcarbamoyltransferase, putative (KAE1) [Plasmodium ovale curtisi]SCP03936.1 tRNA N6-adenosine threonylcarbamoyltransferase, putative [Plasmodium ovale]